MTTNAGVTLQINLAPSDWLHARYILPHQLRQWAKQVDEVLLTLDLHRSHGRFAEGWEERRPKVQHLIHQCCAKYANVRSQEVDYSPEVAADVSAMFFGQRAIPPKDFRGGPFYAYFFGLYSAQHNYVFHLDSDMMFGGGSSSWITEAIQLLAERSDVLVCAPLPGPPTPDGRLRSQIAKSETHPCLGLMFSFSYLSSRVFLLDRNRFHFQIKQLPLTHAPVRGVIKALVEGNCPYNLPEEILTKAMSKHSLSRIDFLGKQPGMWSLHPPYRSENFYQRLPELIQEIEAGDIPEAQRGNHDVDDILVDWTSARAALKQNLWWKRLGRKLKQIFLNQFVLQTR